MMALCKIQHEIAPYRARAKLEPKQIILPQHSKIICLGSSGM